MAKQADEPERDWAAEKADLVVDTVDRIKSLTTDKVVLVARAIVFGLVVLSFAITALILLAIAGIRLADAYLPIGAGVGDATWAAHTLVGGAFVVAGIGSWASRHGEGPPRPLYGAAGMAGLVVLVLIVFGIARAIYQ